MKVKAYYYIADGHDGSVFVRFYPTSAERDASILEDIGNLDLVIVGGRGEVILDTLEGYDYGPG